jgi:hypothetical protein
VKVDDILTVVLVALAIVVLVVAVTVAIRRRGEKKQNNLQRDNQQEEEDSARLSSQEITAHLADHNVDNSQFKTHFHSLDVEFIISMERELQPNPSLVERLHSLDDLIEWQISEDEKWLVHVPPADRPAVLAQLHHSDWEKIQTNIRRMVGLPPGK